MIGLLYLAGIAIWVLIANYFSRRIPRWLGLEKFIKTSQALCFIILLLLPIADELIGRWQFLRLCEQNDVIYLSLDWRDVIRARSSRHAPIQLSWTAIPIEKRNSDFTDVDSGKVFLSYVSLNTNGGILLGKFGLGLGKTTWCNTESKNIVAVKINLYELLKKGEIK